MKEIRTEVRIKTTPSKIWSVLTDTDKFPQWNSFIKSVKGTLAVGQKITVLLEAPDANSMTFKPTGLKRETNTELRWIGHLLIPGIFDGEHVFEIIDKIRTELVPLSNVNNLGGY